MKPKKDTMEVKTLKARKSDRSVKKRGKKYQDKFHVHQSQAQIEIWHSPDVHLTFTWRSPDHLTIIWPSPDPHQILT